MLFVTLTKRFRVEGIENADELDQHTDDVMDALLALETDDVSDADVSAVLSDRIVDITIAAGGEDFDAAVQRADACIRSAIHAAGGATPNWVTIEVSSRTLAPA